MASQVLTQPMSQLQVLPISPVPWFLEIFLASYIVLSNVNDIIIIITSIIIIMIITALILKNKTKQKLFPTNSEKDKIK